MYFEFSTQLVIRSFSRRWAVNALVEDVAICVGGRGSISGQVKWDTISPTAHHCCNVSSELCRLGAKPQRWAAPVFTRFGLIL